MVLMATAILAAQPEPKPLAPTPPPQSARQALIEVFFGKKPDHVKKHLAEITRKAMSRLDTGPGPSFMSEIEAIGMQAQSLGGHLQILETGPTLLSIDQPETHEKFEVTVERDDLIGDEDQIELSFQMFRGGKAETLPFLPRLNFVMKMEAGIWRVTDLNFSARMPLTDSDFLRDLVDQIEEKQQASNEAAAAYSVRAIVGAEMSYHNAHPDKPYSCSLSEMGSSVDSELARGTKNGYVFALTACDALHFKVAAEPATPRSGRLAFCSDESGTINFSRNGKAATCISSGQPYSGNANVVTGFSAD
jgi:hypothetical protein